MTITMISGIASLAVGIAFTVMAFSLPDASIGIPFAPKVFPAGLGILMTVLSILQISQETLRARRSKDTTTEGRDPYLIKILLSCVFALLYALLFHRIGYVLSTVFFLEAELWLFNGRENWKTNTIVAVVFSIAVYVLFSQVLGVFLPRTPIIWI